jgi:hypothetical protein
MKIINTNKIFLLLLCTLLSSNIHAQIVTKEQRVAQQTIENMFGALNVADTASLKKYVTDNVHFYEYGEAWNIDKIVSIALQSKAIPDFKRTNNFEYVRTTIKNEIAWITYYLTSVITRNSKTETINWMETVILVKEKNQWKIDVLHSTRLVKK